MFSGKPISLSLLMAFSEGGPVAKAVCIPTSDGPERSSDADVVVVGVAVDSVGGWIAGSGGAGTESDGARSLDGGIVRVGVAVKPELEMPGVIVKPEVEVPEVGVKVEADVAGLKAKLPAGADKIDASEAGLI